MWIAWGACRKVFQKELVLSVVCNEAKIAGQAETDSHLGTTGSNPSSPFLLTVSLIHIPLLPLKPPTLSPFLTLQDRMKNKGKIRVLGQSKHGDPQRNALSLLPRSDSWHGAWPVHFPGSRSPTSKCFLSTDRITQYCGARQPMCSFKCFPLYSATMKHQHHPQHEAASGPLHQIAFQAPVHDTASGWEP